MEIDFRQLNIKILVTITDRSLANKVSHIFEKHSLPVHYNIIGKGTAGSELLDICGIDGTTRLITLCTVKGSSVDDVLRDFRDYAKFKERGTGIAFTIPVNGAQMHIIKSLHISEDQMEDKPKMKECEVKNSAKYSLILVNCRQGYTGMVMDAARHAGAAGGTIVKGRRDGDSSTMRFLGISTQEEREIVSILASKEDKSRIMKAISVECGVQSEAQSLVLSLPVEDMIGLASAKTDEAKE